jgi:hypothetical protein
MEKGDALKSLSFIIFKNFEKHFAGHSKNVAGQKMARICRPC